MSQWVTDCEVSEGALDKVLTEDVWFSDEKGLSLPYADFEALGITPFVTAWLQDQGVINISFDDIVYLIGAHLDFDIPVVPFEEWIQHLFIVEGDE